MQNYIKGKFYLEQSLIGDAAPIANFAVNMDKCAYIYEMVTAYKKVPVYAIMLIGGGTIYCKKEDAPEELLHILRNDEVELPERTNWRQIAFEKVEGK